MSRATTSGVLRVVALTFLLAAVACFILSRRARTTEQDVVGEAGTVIMREQFKVEGSADDVE